jgi:hypothetical protein
MTRTDSVKDLVVFLDTKLYFHNHIIFIFSHCIKLLGLVRSVTFDFLYLECIFILYLKLVLSEDEYTSVVWNSITSTESKSGTHSAEACGRLFNRFFPQFHYSYALVLEQLKSPTLQKRRYHLDALFLAHVYHGSKVCPSILYIDGLRVRFRYIRTVLCSMSALLVKIVLLLDALQLPKLFVGT